MSIEAPWRGIKQVEPEDSQISILGIPFDGAVSASRGAAAAPDRLRELSKILPPFSEEGIDLRELKLSDKGNVPLNLRWESFFQEVREQAAALLEARPFSLFLGGDHSVTIPLLQAFSSCYRDGNIGVIHLDSHCDLMNEYNGHPWSHACTQRRTLELPNAAPERLALAGIRSYEAEELSFLKDNPGIKVVGARQHFLKGITNTVEQLSCAMAGADAVYISLDIDVLDPAYAPGTGTPEGGGLSTREVMEIIRQLITRLPVRATDIVEVSPPLDSSDITSWAALKIIYEIFGEVVKA